MIKLLIGGHEVIFDRDDGDIVASLMSPRIYSDQSLLYLMCKTIKPKKISTGAHRLVWVKHFGETDSAIDHANGNGLDNRKCNLRLATRGQNRANARKMAKATSKFKGVTKNVNRWQVYCQSKYVGLFKDEVSAAKAYDKCAKETFGEFAKLNFPETL